MIAQRYSASGSSAFEESLSRMLSGIKAAFEQKIPQSLISALVLGGGYGRGEGGVLAQNETEKPYNDLDFFVFTKDINPLQKRSLMNALQILHEELSEQYGIDVDFSVPQRASKLPHMKISQMYFDLRNGHRVVQGNPRILAALPNWTKAELPLTEALRLLLNRAMGLYFAQEKLAAEDAAHELDFINRNIHKAFQAIAEAILIAESNYDSSVSVRAELIRNTDISSYCASSSLLPEMLKAMEFKLKPHIPEFSFEVLQNRLELAIRSLQEVYYALWTKELNTPIHDYDSLAGALESSTNRFSVKNFLLNARDFRLRRFSVAAYGRYPRYRLYLALPYFLFQQSSGSVDITDILGCGPNTEFEQLKASFIKLWQRYN